MILGITMAFLIQYQRHDPWEKSWISWILLKFKTCIQSKTIAISRISRQYMDWEKILMKGHIPDVGLLSKVYKDALKLNNQKTNNLIKIWAKELPRHLIREGIQMANKHIKRCLHYVSSGKWKLKWQWDIPT